MTEKYPLNLNSEFDAVLEKELRIANLATDAANSELCQREIEHLVSQAQAFHTKVQKFVGDLDEVVSNQDIKFGDKLDRLMLLNISLLPIVLAELAPGKLVINTERADQAVRVSSMLKSLETSIYKKRDYESKEEVDLSHPKFQMALDWVMEGVLTSMTNMGIPAQLQQGFIHDFSKRMIGFEEEANKKLRGVSFANLDTVINPLVREFNNERGS